MCHVQLTLQLIATGHSIDPAVSRAFSASFSRRLPPFSSEPTDLHAIVNTDSKVRSISIRKARADEKMVNTHSSGDRQGLHDNATVECNLNDTRLRPNTAKTVQGSTWKHQRQERLQRRQHAIAHHCHLVGGAESRVLKSAWSETNYKTAGVKCDWLD